MTKFTRYSGILITLAVTASALTSTSLAATIYDNSQNYLNIQFASLNEFGDQINFDSNTSERTITNFKFDYYLGATASGNETVDLRLYANDGSSGEPGTLLYDSGSFSISKGFNTAEIDGLSIDAPNTITWSVLFGGFEGLETVGLLLYDPPTVGSSFNDYWEKSSGIWTTKVFNDPIMKANFGAVVTAVPEPGTIQLAVVGAMALLGFSTSRRFFSK